MMYRNAAKQIKLLRIKHDLTQEMLAEKLGVSAKYISAVETNAKKASLEFYKAIANYFKVTFDYLFTDSIEARKNIIIDSVILKMTYMTEEQQKYVLKMIETFTDFVDEYNNKEHN